MTTRIDFVKALCNGIGSYRVHVIDTDGVAPKEETDLYLVREGVEVDEWFAASWRKGDEAVDELSDHNLSFEDAQAAVLELLEETEKYVDLEIGDVYDFDPNQWADDDTPGMDEAVPSAGPVDKEGQHIMFPDMADYTDLQYDAAKEALDYAKAALHDANKEKKRATEIAKMKEYDCQARAVSFQCEDARIQSVRCDARAYVAINARGKLKTICAAEIHTYPFSEISIYQAYHVGMPVSLEDAKEIDEGYLALQRLLERTETAAKTEDEAASETDGDDESTGDEPAEGGVADDFDEKSLPELDSLGNIPLIPNDGEDPDLSDEITPLNPEEPEAKGRRGRKAKERAA